MKKRWPLAFLLPATLVCGLACTAAAEKTAARLAVLKGPTGMGMVALIDWDEAGETANDYTITIAGAPDVLVSQLITGEIDMAALPVNTIAMLYQRTKGQVKALAVSTLGGLYILQRGGDVECLADLSGKTVVCAARGTTVEAVAGYLLDGSVCVRYVSEHAEAIAQAVAGKYDLVLLPEPFVTSLLQQDTRFHIVIDLTAAWEEKSGIPLPMGGIAVRKTFAQDHPEAVRVFLEEYARSVAYVNNNPAEAAGRIEARNILRADVAETSIPRTSIVCLTGGAMRAALDAYFGVLYIGNAALIGGALPDEEFYYDETP